MTMPDPINWSEFEMWHVLVDVLCKMQGHPDNKSLASEFCHIKGSNGQANYEAALRNLGNWRRGAHIPHKKNFIILTRLLKIDNYDGLKPIWNRLYTQARKNINEKFEGENSELVAPSNTRISSPVSNRLPTFIAVVLVGFMVVGIWVGQSSGFFRGMAIIGKSGTVATKANRHEFYLNLKIGETAILGGARTDCDKAPPPWGLVGPGLLKLKIGTLSDGGIGRRYSIACKGTVPMRAIKFTATQKGREEFMLYSDRTTIDVQ